ncbi:MAG: hypothetical protein U0074_21250 [Kouleothrix sp.]
MPIAAHTNSLQLALWSLWTAALVVCAALQWHTNVVAGQALNVLALIIHCGLTGLVGLSDHDLDRDASGTLALSRIRRSLL